jgi:hypothetical protein
VAGQRGRQWQRQVSIPGWQVEQRKTAQGGDAIECSGRGQALAVCGPWWSSGRRVGCGATNKNTPVPSWPCETDPNSGDDVLLERQAGLWVVTVTGQAQGAARGEQFEVGKWRKIGASSEKPIPPS